MKLRKDMAAQALPNMHRTANAQGAQVGREKKQTKDDAEKRGEESSIFF